VWGELDTERFVLEGLSARPVPFELWASPRLAEAETLIVDARVIQINVLGMFLGLVTISLLFI